MSDKTLNKQIEKFKRYKAKAEDLRREADRADGAYVSLMNELDKAWDCTTIEEAEELLAKYEAKTSKAEKRFTKALTEFEEEWGEYLEEMGDED